MATLTLSPGTLLQSTFSKVGDGCKYDTIELLTTPTKKEYTAKNPIKLNPGTAIKGDKQTIIKLIPKAPTAVWGVNVPVFSGSGEGFIIQDVTFDGNFKNQTVAHGKGYHNFLGFSNATDIKINNVVFQNSMGDGARITDSTRIEFSNNTVFGVGHDGLYCDRCKDVEAFCNYIHPRINSGLRCKGSSNVIFRNNCIIGSNAYTPRTGPAIQVQNSEKSETSENIKIYENYIDCCLGPGIWAVTHTNPDPEAAKDIVIRNNIIRDCGGMPAVNRLPGVAGISLDGWDAAKIYNNTFDFNFGAGIRIGNYITKSAGEGYEVTIKNNIVTNTQTSMCADEASGYGIVDITSNHYVTSESNCLYGNRGEYYNIESSCDVLEDPLYKGDRDYHLQSTTGSFGGTEWASDKKNSPCIFPDHELGAYGGTVYASKYSYPAVIIPRKTKEDLKLFIAVLRENGYIDDDDKIRFENVNDGFKA